MTALFKKKAEEKMEKPEEKTSNIEAGEKAEKKAEKKEIKTKVSKVTEDIILEPWITEKSHAQMAENKYIFRVHPETDKEKIRNAIQAMFNVKVVDVNVINIPSKKRVYGRFVGRKSGYKKAIVTLKEGDKIELFKGV